MSLLRLAATLGVCTTVLKKVCRRHGIRRWPQRKLQSLNKLIDNLHHAMQATDVAEEHQRLACEIANLQTRKAILTAPIDRSGVVTEKPSQEELLAQHRDGSTDPLRHAHLVAEHARMQLREGDTVSASPKGAARQAAQGESDDDDDDDDGAQDEGSTVELLMNMR